jgi:hypothetical protein
LQQTARALNWIGWSLSLRFFHGIVEKGDNQEGAIKISLQPFLSLGCRPDLP